METSTPTRKFKQILEKVCARTTLAFVEYCIVLSGTERFEIPPKTASNHYFNACYDSIFLNVPTPFPFRHTFSSTSFGILYNWINLVLTLILLKASNNFITSCWDYWFKVKRKNLCMHEEKIIWARVIFFTRSPKILLIFGLLLRCYPRVSCTNRGPQENSAQFHLEGVSMKIDSICYPNG